MTKSAEAPTAQAEVTVKNLLAGKSELEKRLAEKDARIDEIVAVNKKANITIKVLEQRLDEEIKQNTALRVMASELQIAENERQQAASQETPA